MADETSIQVNFARPVPLFPLEAAALLPQQVLPLHIFEPRYQAMIRECLTVDRSFGIVLIREGSEAADPLAVPYLVGTSARIIDHKDIGDGRMDVVAFGPDRLPAVFDEIERWSPRMDFADGCAVVLAHSNDRAFVLTTDFRDFAIYGVPFASPEGAFHTS